MSAESAVREPRAGDDSVIHDIGYHRYDGPRLGRLYAVRSLYAHGLRSAFGLGRGAKGKVFPWSVIGLVVFVAVVVAAIRSQTGTLILTYASFPNPIVLLPILFCAVVAPELVSRDLRGGVLPLYFSRPVTRRDYALAKLAAIITAVWLLLAGPELIIFLGGAFSVKTFHDFTTELGHYSQGLLIAAVYAVVFGSLALLIASLAGRRAVAAALIVAIFVVTTPVYLVLEVLAHVGTRRQPGALTGSALAMSQWAGVVSPMTLIAGLSRWWFTSGDSIGPYGPLYAAVALGLTALSVFLLLWRYRRVAR
jgi:ABC-2 type transport system permease protein